MCDARLFAPQIAQLSTLHAVHVAPFLDDSIDAIAASILANAPPRFALAGLSMGGIVAMRIAALAPDRVDRLALFDTNARAETIEAQARRGPQIQRAQDGGLAEVMRNEMKPRYLAEGPGRAGLLDLCLDMALGLGAEIFARQSTALKTRPDQRASLAAYHGPVLVAHGVDDSLCPPEYHDEMHALCANSILRRIKKAAHLPTLENPAATNAALMEWLEM